MSKRVKFFDIHYFKKLLIILLMLGFFQLNKNRVIKCKSRKEF